MYYQTLKEAHFRLPRPIIPPDIELIVRREIKRQEVAVVKANKKQLKRLAAICDAIEKNGLPENLVMQKLPRKLGMGVFLHPKAKPLPKGTLIGSYAGEVTLVGQNRPGESSYAFAPLFNIHLSREEQSHFDRAAKYRPKRLYALDVDAIKTGNFIRYINHSENPNIEAEIFAIPKNQFHLSPSPLEVIYMVKKKILPGEQLLICYEGDDKSYWNSLDILPFPMNPNTFICK